MFSLHHLVYFSFTQRCLYVDHTFFFFADRISILKTMRKYQPSLTKSWLEVLTFPLRVTQWCSVKCCCCVTSLNRWFNPKLRLHSVRSLPFSPSIQFHLTLQTHLITLHNVTSGCECVPAGAPAMSWINVFFSPLHIHVFLWPTITDKTTFT